MNTPNREKRKPFSVHEDTMEKLVKVRGQMELTNGKVKSLNTVLDRLIDNFWKNKKEAE